MNDDFIQIDEIMQVLDCTYEQVLKELRAGNLPGVKIGKPWRVPRQAFLQRINEMALENCRPAKVTGLRTRQPAPRG